MSDPPPEQRPPFVLNRDFIETAFANRFQKWLRHAQHNRDESQLNSTIGVD